MAYDFVMRSWYVLEGELSTYPRHKVDDIALCDMPDDVVVVIVDAEMNPAGIVPKENSEKVIKLLQDAIELGWMPPCVEESDT